MKSLLGLHPFGGTRLLYENPVDSVAVENVHRPIPCTAKYFFVQGENLFLKRTDAPIREYFQAWIAIVNNPSTEGVLSESFEGETFPPAGWKVIDGGSPDETWERYTNNPITGNASASIWYSNDAHDDWLITPPLNPVPRM